MLVLSRKIRESLVIDQDIRIVVLQVSKGSVRLGIEAPSQVPIHRQEVLVRLQHESDGTCERCA